MANPEHLEILRQGVEAWNQWRAENPGIKPDLVMTDLRGATLNHADLHRANFSGVNLDNAILSDANLTEIDLSGADLNRAMLNRANLHHADLSGALLRQASLMEADLTEALLSGADLSGATLCDANLSRAELDTTNLTEATLARANLTHAILTATLLTEATLTGARLDHATLSGCRVGGVVASNIELTGATQSDLVCNKPLEAEITVDNLETAQWVERCLYGPDSPDNPLTTQAVLILGWYPSGRKALFDTIREALRQRHYVPILFDDAFLTSHDLEETLVKLARLSRFVIADLTSPILLPDDLMGFVRDLPVVAVQPIILASQREDALFEHLLASPSMLPLHEYKSETQLIVKLAEWVIEPAERRVIELRPKVV